MVVRCVKTVYACIYVYMTLNIPCDQYHLQSVAPGYCAFATDTHHYIHYIVIIYIVILYSLFFMTLPTTTASTQLGL